jgi:hypothetical protein
MTSNLPYLFFAVSKLALRTIPTAALFLPAAAKLGFVEAKFAIIRTWTRPISVRLGHTIDKGKTIDSRRDTLRSVSNTAIHARTVLHSARSTVWMTSTSPILTTSHSTWDREHARIADTRNTNHRTRHVAAVPAELRSTRVARRAKLRVQLILGMDGVRMVNTVLYMRGSIASIDRWLVIVLLPSSDAIRKARDAEGLSWRGVAAGGTSSSRAACGVIYSIRTIVTRRSTKSRSTIGVRLRGCTRGRNIRGAHRMTVHVSMVELHLRMMVGSIWIKRKRWRAHWNGTIWGRTRSSTAEAVEIQTHATRVSSICVITMSGGSIAITRSIWAIGGGGVRTARDAARDRRFSERRGDTENIIAMVDIAPMDGRYTRLVRSVCTSTRSAVSRVGRGGGSAVLEVRCWCVERAAVRGTCSIWGFFDSLAANFGLLMLPLDSGASVDIAMGRCRYSRIFSGGAIIIEASVVEFGIGFAINREVLESIAESVRSVVVSRGGLSRSGAIGWSAFNSAVRSLRTTRRYFALHSRGFIGRFEAGAVAVSEDNDLFIGRFDDGFRSIFSILSLS